VLEVWLNKDCSAIYKLVREFLAVLDAFLKNELFYFENFGKKLFDIYCCF
jgi:hypothetical protein